MKQAKELISMQIEQIIPYENNPRDNTNAIDKVAASIKEFGFQSPIIVDKDYVIICGHTRYAAAKKLKLQTVPVIIADQLSDEQVKAYRLADNKTSEFALWDNNLLDLELGELFSADYDMTQFGFDNLIGDDNYGTDFNLPDGEKSNLQQITFTLTNEQMELVKSVLEQVEESDETFGNTNKNGNKLYEVFVEWAEQKI